MEIKEDFHRLHVTKSSLGVVLVAFSAFLLWRALHGLFVDPLRGFPGPWWARFTRIPYWIANIKGTSIFFMRELHTKYGPVVRFSPNELSYTDVRAWKDIYGYDKGRSENLKAPEFHSKSQSGTYSMLSSSTTDHTRIRRLFAPVFSDRYLKQQEALFRKYVDLLMIKLHEAERQPVDMAQMSNLATFDIMGDFGLGSSLGLLEGNEYSWWLKLTFDSVKVLPFGQLISYYPWLSKAFNLMEPKWLTDMKVSHFRYTCDRVDQRLAKDPDHPDVWSVVLSAKTGNGLTINEMHANADFLMMAGAETTGTLLSGIIYLLLQHPAYLERLKTEVRGQAAVSTLTFEKLAGLKYLNACLQEALRIYPPIPVGVPRVISHDNGGQMVCGRWVPSGTRVSIHHYSTYRSPTNFKDADLYIPERWLGEDDAYKDDRRDAHQPFSFGPRNCLGQNMAWHEMRLILGLLIATFDLELCEETRGWMDQKVFSLWEKKPLLVRLKPVTE